MPVIRIEALVEGEPDLQTLLVDTSEAAARAFSIPAKQCWVTFSRIEPGTYLEGSVLRDEADAAEVSPLVTVSVYQGRDLEQKAALLREIALAVGHGLHVDPDNVFVELREIPRGHVFTGGNVLS